DDVRLHLQAPGDHADGVADAVHAVHRVVARDVVEHDVARRIGDPAGIGADSADVFGADLAGGRERDGGAAVDADQVLAAEAGKDGADAHVRVRLCGGEGSADCPHRGGHVDDDAL